MESTHELYEKFVLGTYSRMPLSLVRGEGPRVWDEEGREFLDFGAGIAVTSIGHSHPALVSAIAGQAARLIHTSNLYHTRPQGLLAAKLVELAGAPGKVFCCNSGAEANEGLIKLARLFGNLCGRAPRHEIITFSGSFHGRTMAGISATGQEKVKAGFAPLLEGFRTVGFNDMEAVRSVLNEKTCAILIEAVQGEGGIHPAGADFLRALRALCDEHDLLLLFDEVQCGLGRTGDWCGWKSICADDLRPDGISWAKGIAGGFPLGAFWVGEREVVAAEGEVLPLHGLFRPGTHGTTYGGGPLGCAAALAVLQAVEHEGLLANAVAMGNLLRREIAGLASPWIRDIRGLGLLTGIELVAGFPTGSAPSPAARLAGDLVALGLLTVVSGSHVVRFLPPLNIGADEIRCAVALLRGALDAVG